MRKKDQVLNIMFPSKLDEGVEDLENVVFTDREAQESFVFEQVNSKECLFQYFVLIEIKR